jgi:hypothetical protein
MTNTNALNLIFINSTGLSDDNVYITFQCPNGQVITYGQNNTAVSLSQGNLMTTSLSLEEIGSSGFMVSTLLGGIVYVSYGVPLDSTTSAPAFIGGGTDYNTQFQTIELTYTGNPADQGDLTAINYFTSTIGIKSYAGGQSGTLLQSVGYSDYTSNAIAKQLIAIAPQAAVYANEGNLIRIVGPSSYGPSMTNPYPNFSAYLNAISLADQSTTISNSSSFVNNAPQQTNYEFTFNLTANVSTANSTINLEGSVSVTITPPGEPSSLGPTFNNCTVTIDTSSSQFMYTLYGQTTSEAVSFSGSGWTEINNYMTANSITPPDALNILQSQVIGEITGGLLCGFINSDVIAPSQTAAFKSMASSVWWTVSPPMEFSEVQPQNSNYYDQYANVIFTASNNGAYSFPYSDRFREGPLINSVEYNGKTVDTWVITLNPPTTNIQN